MGPERKENGKKDWRKKPLTQQKLADLSLSYLAKFATSSAKFEAYLRRKLRERGWEGEGEPDLDSLVRKYIALGYIDDAQYAAARSRSLQSRGFGGRRIAQDLFHAGIDDAIQEDVRPTRIQQREAAVRLARKRRFGPFYRQEIDDGRAQKQIGALLRAGHALDDARFVVAARSENELEAWLADEE